MSERLKTLVALSERVQAATGPDRGLDASICCALGYASKWLINSCDDRRKLMPAARVYVGGWISAGKNGPGEESKPVTHSLDAAVALLNHALPGWWWKVGTCCVSDDACIAPDYNDPAHSGRLAGEFPLPEERYLDPDENRLTWGPFDEGFDVDRRPPGNVSLALLEAMLDALIYIEELRLKSEGSR